MDNEQPRDLITFAKSLGSDLSTKEFLELLNEVVDLDALRNLSDEESQNLFDATQFLADYMMLQREFYGQEKTLGGHPYVVYNGPFIETQLTRPTGKAPNFSYLETYGAEE